MNIRNGTIVYNVGDYKGRRCVLSMKDYATKDGVGINQAKKSNGLNARTLQRGEALPPTIARLKEIEEAQKTEKDKVVDAMRERVDAATSA